MFLAALLPVARMIRLPDISAMAVAIQAHLTAGYIPYAQL